MTKKIAIFHDYFDVIGGAEKLVLAIAKALKADIISTDVELECIKKSGFEDVKLIDLGKNPRFPGLKDISATFKFLTCRFSDQYDFFILSGNWAHYAALHHHPNLYYCHTPVRAFYDLKACYLKAQKGLKKMLFYFWAWWHSELDKYSIKHVDKIVVNSKNVQERVKRFYGIEAEVVYTALPTSKYYCSGGGDFWLSVNRLYLHKRIELQLEIFRKLQNEKLKIVGWYSKGSGVEKYVKSLKIPENVQLLGEIDEKQLIKLYAECKGVIATAMDEDLGLAPLEGMASGKVVLATDEGGYRETIINGKTGFLLPPTPEAFVNKINELSVKERDKMKSACIKRAQEFDEKIFIEKLRAIIESYPA